MSFISANENKPDFVKIISMILRWFHEKICHFSAAAFHIKCVTCPLRRAKRGEKNFGILIFKMAMERPFLKANIIF